MSRNIYEVISRLIDGILNLMVLFNQRRDLFVIWFIKYRPAWLTANLMTGVRFAIALTVNLFLVVAWGRVYPEIIWWQLCIAYLSDAVDGPLARLDGPTRFGDLFDKITDLFLLVPLGAVLFWSVDRPLVLVGFAGGFVRLGTWLFRRKISLLVGLPDTVMGKYAMLFFSLAVFIGLWQLDYGRILGWVGYTLVAVDYLRKIQYLYNKKISKLDLNG